MSTPNSTRSSPCFHPEDPDAIKTANSGGSTIRKDMQRLNIKAEVYNPPPHDQGNSGNDYLAAAVSSSLNLPNFWLERPHTWFNMCESAFAVRNITSPLTEYHHCVGKLPQETVASIEDVVNNFEASNDPYKELKQRLCRAYGQMSSRRSMTSLTSRRLVLRNRRCSWTTFCPCGLTPPPR